VPASVPVCTQCAFVPASVPVCTQCAFVPASVHTVCLCDFVPASVPVFTQCAGTLCLPVCQCASVLPFVPASARAARQHCNITNGRQGFYEKVVQPSVCASARAAKQQLGTAEHAHTHTCGEVTTRRPSTTTARKHTSTQAQRAPKRQHLLFEAALQIRLDMAGSESARCLMSDVP
jgi:hypothetical protein